MDISIRGIDKLRKKFNPALLEKSIAYGLRRTTTTAIAQAVREVTKIYNIRKRDVKSKIKVQKATQKVLRVDLKIASEPIGVEKFYAKKITITKTVKSKKGKTYTRKYVGMSAKIKKKERRKKYRKIFLAQGGRIKKPLAMRMTKEKNDKGKFKLARHKVVSPTTMFKIYGVKKIEEVFDTVFLERTLKNYEWRVGKI